MRWTMRVHAPVIMDGVDQRVVVALLVFAVTPASLAIWRLAIIMEMLIVLENVTATVTLQVLAATCV